MLASPARLSARLTGARLLKEPRVFLMVPKMTTRDAEILKSSAAAPAGGSLPVIVLAFIITSRCGRVLRRLSITREEATNWFPWKCSKTNF